MSAREVVVVGSGSAGLSAALAAAEAGARVTVIEAAAKAGGTTALSGDVAWIPGHPADDTPAAALAYLDALGLGDHDGPRCEVFVREAATIARAIESRTALEWQPLAYPDYHAEMPGGRPEGGRSLEPRPLAVAPARGDEVRDAPNVGVPITYHELATGEFDIPAALERARAGVLTLGRALIAALLDAARAAGPPCASPRAPGASSPSGARSSGSRSTTVGSAAASCSRAAASSATPSSGGRSCAGRCSGRSVPPPAATGCGWRWRPAPRSET